MASVVLKIKLVFLGPKESGKTSIINRKLFDSFTEEYSSTIGIDFICCTTHLDNLTIRSQCWDTSGQERFWSLLPSYTRNSNGIIIVFDSSQRESFEIAKNSFNDFSYTGCKNIFVLANKIDLNNIQVEAEEVERVFKGKVYYVSAKTGEGIESAYLDIIKTCTKREEENKAESQEIISETNPLTTVDPPIIEALSISDNQDVQIPSTTIDLPIIEALSISDNQDAQIPVATSAPLDTQNLESSEEQAKSDEKNISYKYKIVVLGGEKSGKTSIISRKVFNDFNEDYKPTIGADFIKKSMSVYDKEISLELWDVSGSERFRSLLGCYVRQSSAMIIVFDCTSRDSYEQAKKLYENMRPASSKETLFYVFGTKIDLNDIQVHFDEVKNDFGLQVFYVSSKTGEGITSAFMEIANELIGS